MGHGAWWRILWSLCVTLVTWKFDMQKATLCNNGGYGTGKVFHETQKIGVEIPIQLQLHTHTLGGVRLNNRRKSSLTSVYVHFDMQENRYFLS